MTRENGLTSFRRQIAAILISVPLIATGAIAEDAPAPAAKGGIPTYNFDLRTLTSDDVLPFDQEFTLRGQVDPSF